MTSHLRRKLKMTSKYFSLGLIDKNFQIRERNGFTKEITKELIWQKKLSEREFPVFWVLVKYTKGTTHQPIHQGYVSKIHQSHVFT